MLWALGTVVLAIAAILVAWQWDLLPRETIATGTLRTPDGKVLKTRRYYRSSREERHKSPAPGPLQKIAVWEVQLPSGRWVDCDGEDCLTAYERHRN